MLQIKNTLGGGKPEGLYAWKKNEVNESLKSVHDSTVIIKTKQISSVYYSKEYSIDENSNIVLKNPQVISWTTANNSEIFNAIKGKYIIVGDYDTSYARHDVLSASSGVYVCYVPEDGTYASGGDYLDFTATVYSGEITYTFLDYIVSDKETAYPDGGEKGGYWYERVGESITPYLFSDFDAEGYPATFKINTDVIPESAFAGATSGNIHPMLFSKISNLDIKANSSGAFAFSGGFYGNTQSLKIKIRVGTIASPMFDGIDKASNVKAWLSNEVISIDGYLADFANAGAFADTKIYCEVGSKPSGWDSNWNKRYLYTATYSTMWGVSESDFDAL